jgi:Sigma-70, region 4
VEVDFMNKQEHKQQLDADILAVVKTGFHLTYKEIGIQFGVSEGYVRQLAARNGFMRKRGAGSPAARAKRRKLSEAV